MTNNLREALERVLAGALDVSGTALILSNSSEEARLIVKDARAALAATAERGVDKCREPDCCRKGEPGNENIIEGRPVCDFCHAKMMNATPQPEPLTGAVERAREIGEAVLDALLDIRSANLTNVSPEGDAKDEAIRDCHSGVEAVLDRALAALKSSAPLGYDEGVEAAAKVAESCEISGPLTTGWADGASSAARQIATAIRALSQEDQPRA